MRNAYVAVATMTLAANIVGCGGTTTINDGNPAESGASEQAQNSVTVNAGGIGQIAYAHEGEPFEFNDASSQTVTIAVKTDEGFKFVK